jgi:enamine deaminase RidA (YjgF/YER057c/UK114 family)
VPASVTINNKYQRTAHSYSDDVLEENTLGQHNKTTPKFERARLINEAVFISGTASITGEDSIHIGLPAEQTHLSIENIKHLLNELDNFNVQMPLDKATIVRVYIKHGSDFDKIKAICQKAYKNCQIIYVKGDVCRPELLVEIELMSVLTQEIQ